MCGCGWRSRCSDFSYHDGDDISDDGPFIRLRFFFFAVKLSCPLSVFESLSESELDESELDDEEEELELLELSDANPVLSCKLTRSAISAISGCFSYCTAHTVRPRIDSRNSSVRTFRTRSHFLESFGRPRTVLCQTIGKLVLLQKFCVTAIVSSKFRTTCHQPPGTNTVSPGFWRISI